MIVTIVRTPHVDAAATWRDPEFWGPKGRGCARCHERLPIVRDAGFGDGAGLHGALCEDCLGRCFNGWSFERLVDWLGNQHTVLIRDGKRAAALKAARRHDLEPAREYEQEYGVWLIPWRPSPSRD